MKFTGIQEENQSMVWRKKTESFFKNNLNEDAPVTVNFVGYLLERLENHKSVKEYITLENLQETEKFLRACVSVEQNKTPCYIREFSIQHFQDSKYFDR